MFDKSDTGASMPVGDCVMDTSDIGKIGSYCERNNAAGPTKSIPGDDDACSRAARIVVDLSDQLLHFVYTAQYNVAFEDGLTIDDGICNRTECKRIASDKTGAYFST